MAIEIWDHPPYEHNTTYYKQELTVLHNKLLSLGLIDYTGNNLAELDAIGNIDLGSFSTTTSRNPFPLGTLYYKLPVGDDSINLADVVGEDYKTIVEESYSSTNCYIKIHVYMRRYNTVGYSANYSDSRYFIISFDVSYSQTMLFSNAIVVNSILGYGSVSDSATNSFTITRSSMIYLSGDVLHIQFLSLKSTRGLELDYTHYYHAPHMILFTLYRSDDCINVLYPSFNNNIASINTNAASSQFTQPRLLIINKNDSQVLHTSQENFIQNGVVNYLPIDVNSKKYFLFTYANINKNIKVNPSVIKGLATNTTAQSAMNYSDIIIKYRGHKVKVKYFDLGDFYMPYRWSPLNNSVVSNMYTQFSYHIFINDHPCTTNSVGGL